MDRHNILSLLGLSLRGGRLAVGEEPVESVARARDARVLLLAADAAEGTRRRCEHFAARGDCLWLQLPFTKEEFGRALGRTSVAIAAVTDVGLAIALLRRLAEMDPEQYREMSDRMDVKARRAAERRAEQSAREKNMRQGRRSKSPQDRSGKIPPDPSPPNSPAGGSRSPGTKYRRPRPAGADRPKPKAKTNPYAHSRPVKKGKGSFRRKKEG